MKMVHFKFYTVILFTKASLIYKSDRTILKFYNFCYFSFIFSECPFVSSRQLYCKNGKSFCSRVYRDCYYC